MLKAIAVTCDGASPPASQPASHRSRAIEPSETRAKLRVREESYIRRTSSGIFHFQPSYREQGDRSKKQGFETSEISGPDFEYHDNRRSIPRWYKNEQLKMINRNIGRGGRTINEIAGRAAPNMVVDGDIQPQRGCGTSLQSGSTMIMNTAAATAAVVLAEYPYEVLDSLRLVSFSVKPAPSRDNSFFFYFEYALYRNQQRIALDVAENLCGRYSKSATNELRLARFLAETDESSSRRSMQAHC